jgi:hypothetical protein
MTIDTIQQEIKTLQQKMNAWPDEEISVEYDRSQVLALTDKHFRAVETDLEKVLEQCKKLSIIDQSIVAPYLKELRVFVQNKFDSAEKELIEIKNRMDLGRNHAQAIRAYTK